MAVPFVPFVAGSWIDMLVLWPALSGGAILLEQFVTGPLLIEAGEENDALLRRTEDNREGELDRK